MGPVVTHLELEVLVGKADVDRQAASTEATSNFFFGEGDVEFVLDFFEERLGIFESAESSKNPIDLTLENIENSLPEGRESPTKRLLEKKEHELTFRQLEVEGELDGCCLSTFENNGLFDRVVLPGFVGRVAVMKEKLFPGHLEQGRPVLVSPHEDVVSAVCFRRAEILDSVRDWEGSFAFYFFFVAVVDDREEAQAPLGFRFLVPMAFKEIDSDQGRSEQCHEED